MSIESVHEDYDIRHRVAGLIDSEYDVLAPMGAEGIAVYLQEYGIPGMTKQMAEELAKEYFGDGS